MYLLKETVDFMRPIKTLTGLRFLAACYAFIFHINLPFRTPLTWLPGRIQTVIQQGSLGVTVFFVLSGFVLAYSHLKDFRTPEVKGLGYTGRFMFKRMARIYPVFLVGMLACFLVSLRTGTLPGWKLMLMSAVFVQTYFPSLAMRWYDSGAWSVANEIFFYLLFPLLLPLVLRLRTRTGLFIALAGVILVNGGIGLAFRLHPEWNQLLEYAFPPSRLPEFIAGILIAVLISVHGWKMPVWTAVVGLLLTAVYLAFGAPHFNAGSLIHHLVLLPVLAVVFAVLYQPVQSPVFAWLESRPMQYLGQISYCFYIAQLPLLFMLAAVLDKGYIRHDNWLVLPVLLMVSLLCAVLLHELVEKKAHLAAMSWYKKNLTEQASVSQGEKAAA